MTTYYVDIGSPGAWNGRTGLDTTGNQLLGLSGLQNLLDTISAADIAYVKGTGDASKIMSVPYDNPSGGLTNGEAVTWHDGGGVVQYKGAQATPVWIEKTSGNNPDNNDVITGTTSGNTIQQNGAVTVLACHVDTNAGTNAAGPIKVIGVNSSWTKDGTRAVIDGNDACADEMVSVTKEFWWWENLAFRNASGANSGFQITTGGEGNIIINCEASGNGSYGFDVGLYYATFIRCTAFDNVDDGFNVSQYNGKFLFCSSHDNGGDGFDLTGTFSYMNTLFGCLIYDNTGIGVNGVGTTDLLIGCTVNGNAGGGIAAKAATSNKASLIVGARITNHSGAGDIGLNCNSENLMTLGCYFEDNDGDNIQNATLHYNIPLDGSATSSNAEDQADTNEGYTDKTNGAEDFNLRSDATLRRIAIGVPIS